MTGKLSEHAEARGQLDRLPLSRRSVWVGAGAVGAPTAISYLHPAFGLIFAGSEVAMITVVFVSALFGTLTISERAFRLLRWLANRPEPRQNE